MQSIKPLVLLAFLVVASFVISDIHAHPRSTSSLAVGARAVQDTVRGTVTNAETGDPLPGVNVVVKGTTLGTATDAQGAYSLQVPSLQDTLVFSFIGYEMEEVPVAGRAMIDVALAPSVLRGEEVLVVGYTEQQRESITGAVSSISAEEIAQRKVSTLGEALKGRIPGVMVNSTGEPGEPARIVIRGISFIGNNSPLYVVDGMYVRSIRNLNPDNIASIQVLKDAAAAAQYGAQAANGVIVITTKRGTPGETRISFGASYGFQEIPTRIDMMEAQEWAQINRTAYENAGEEPMAAALNPEQFANTDWQAALFQPGSMMDYNLSISGGSSNATYLVSAGYLKEEGTIVGTSFERYSLRVNSEINKGILTIGESVALSRYVKENMIGFPFIDALRMLPTIPVYDSTTTSGFGFGSRANYTFGTNPVGMQKMTDNTHHSNQIIGSLYGELEIFDNLTYRLNLGLEYEDFTNRAFRQQGRIRLNNPLTPAHLTVNENSTSSLLVENLLTFDDTFGEHSIQAVAGLIGQREEFNHLMLYRENYSDERLRVIDAGTEDISNAGNKVISTMRSYLLRVNYSYDDRYLFTGNFRRDGSSRFGEDYRFGNFLSGAVGWAISEEAFYASIPVLSEYVDYFKLRASYGELGNQDIGDYEYVGLIQQNLSYILGAGRIASGAIQRSLANPNIRWQENRQMNVGVDLDLFDRRLSVTADYYVSESNGLLVQAPLPPSLGSAESPFINAGSIRNSGFELGLQYQYYGGEGFQLNASANLTTINNEVLQLGNGNQPIFAGPFGVARTAVGGPVGVFYVWETDGIFQSEEEVLNHTSMVDTDGDGEPDTEVVIQPDAEPGDIRYVDQKNKDGLKDGLINDQDRYLAGSPFPDFSTGFTLDGSYKNFDFALLLRGVYGNKIFNVPKFWTNRMDDNSNYREGLDPWTPTNRDTDTPRAIFGPQGSMNAHPNSDRWIEDGSYLRVQNVEIGYTLPSSLMQHLGLEDGAFRIYANVQNLYTFTGYSNWDPEITGTGILSLGVDDRETFPSVRSFTIGLDVSL